MCDYQKEAAHKTMRTGLSFRRRYGKKQTMEKIDPQRDHKCLHEYYPGLQVMFSGQSYTIQRRTTLASGEAAVVLQSATEQFEISAKQFLAGVQH